MARIIMCGSFKGGVGKTASSWNLAYSLAEMGKRVLAVDFDSQANLTTCFGVEDPAAVPVTIGHLMMNRLEDEEMPDPSEFIQSRNGVDFIPSSMMLSAVDSKLRIDGNNHLISRRQCVNRQCSERWTGVYNNTVIQPSQRLQNTSQHLL